MEYCVKLWLSHFKKGVEKLQLVQQTGIKVIWSSAAFPRGEGTG